MISSSYFPGDLFTDEPFVHACTLGNRNEITLDAFLDTGATGHVFIDESMVRTICEQLQIEPQKLTKPKPVRGFDGRQAPNITHAIYPTMTMQDHRENLLPLLITELGQHGMILGKPWMRKHGLLLYMKDDKIMFWPGHCTHPGAPGLPTPMKMMRQTTSASNKPEQTRTVRQILVRPEETCTERSAPLSVPFKKIGKGLSERISQKSSAEDKPIDCALIGPAAYKLLTKEKDVQIFAISLRDIDYQLNKECSTPTDPKTKVPEEYHNFLKVFSKAESDELAPHSPYDHRILLTGDQAHGHSYLRSMSRMELEFVKKYLEDNLRKGFIEASHAACSSTILSAKKPGGGLRFCVDYRKLNQLSKKDRYPLPLIDKRLAQLKEAKVFSKLDIRQAFHKLRMARESEDLTTFNCRFGAYKYKVLPFGLTGGPSSWQHFINDILFEYLDKFCSAYLDDILIYSKNITEHREHVRKVLAKLQEAGLQVDVDKCEFHVIEVKYLGLIITTEGIKWIQPRFRP